MRCLITEAEIQAAVAELARKISSDYAGSPLTLLGILTGSIMLVSDLMRRITLPHKLGLLQASSYRGAATSPEKLLLNLDLLPDLTGRDVLLVDDILDTGATLLRLRNEIAGRGVSSVRTAV